MALGHAPLLFNGDARSLTSLTRLPLELIHRIVTTAAKQHRYSALSLALVSHATLSWVRHILWSTIVIRRPSQLRALLDLLAACSIPPQWRGPPPSSPAHAHLAPSPEDVELRDGLAREVCGIAWDLSKSLSLPTTSLPVRSAYIELEADHNIEDVVEAWDEAHRQSSQRAWEKRTEESIDDAWSMEASEGELNRIKNLARLQGRRLLQAAFRSLDLVHLGSAEVQYLGQSGDAILGGQPREMSIVYSGDDEVVKRMLLPYQAPMTSPGQEGTTDFGLVGIRSRLERLHIVGIDPRAGLAGVSLPPWLECFRTGSTSEGSFLHSLATHLPMDTPRRVMQHHSTGIKYLRFDTRRFSFKPPEIVALRLRPYFQEVCVSRPLITEANVGAADSSSDSAGTSSVHVQGSTRSQSGYSYSGPRHAAPARGAGNRASLTRGGIPDAAAAPIPLHHDASEEAAYLREIGAGGFRRLHLAWDTRSDPTPEEVPWFKRARYSQGHDPEPVPTAAAPSTEGGISATSNGRSSDDASKDSITTGSAPRPDPSGARTAAGGRIQTESTAQDSGGWPAERRDTWTERSEKELISSFAAEFADAVQVLYGWEGYNLDGHALTAAAAEEEVGLEEGTRTAFSRALHGQGELIDRVERGWDEATRFLLDCIAQGMGATIKSKRPRVLREVDGDGIGGSGGSGSGSGIPGSTQGTQEDGPVSTGRPTARPEEEPIRRPRYAVRAPASALKLGGHAAFESEERLRLFEDRASGGRGAWT